MTEKNFISYDPEQLFLLPPDLRDWLPADHMVYFIIDVVKEINLKPFFNQYNSTGRPSYHPRMMLGVLLYAYCTGITSSRKIEKACHESIAFRVLSADQKPDHDTISNFRSKHLSDLSCLFKDILHLCSKAGLVKLGNIAIDGSKFKANASKHKAMSYDRIQPTMERLEQEIKALLDESMRVDADEDAKYGKGKRADEIPHDLKIRKSRLEKIRQAKQELEEEALEKANYNNNDNESKSGKTEKTSSSPRPTAQRNFTDSDSRIMKDGASKEFIQGYNSQVAVDSKTQIIVASHLSQEANDKNQIEVIIGKLEINEPSAKGCQITADAGYFSEKNIEFLEKKYDPYIATGRIKHGASQVAPKGRIPQNASVKERMARKLRTMKGKNIYKMRKAIVEPVFGQIKHCQGIRSFLLRGYEKVSKEWDFICATHNLNKLFRYNRIVLQR